MSRPEASGHLRPAAAGPTYYRVVVPSPVVASYAGRNLFLEVKMTVLVIEREPLGVTRRLEPLPQERRPLVLELQRPGPELQLLELLLLLRRAPQQPLLLPLL